MKFEVERKYHLADVSDFRARAAQQGVQFGEPQIQFDTYYGHPARDFGETDEALRIRRTESECKITYKGPKTDDSSKTRPELDIDLTAIDPDGDQFTQLVTALGFHEVIQIKKAREGSHLHHDQHDFMLCLDQVASLGWFVELETVAEEGDVPVALRALDSLAAQLDLANDQRRSYLELLLDQRQ